MIVCADCKHLTYWHERRRADEPSQSEPCECMICGCGANTPHPTQDKEEVHE